MLDGKVVSHFHWYTEVKKKLYVHRIEACDTNSVIANSMSQHMTNNVGLGGNERTIKTHLQSLVTLECMGLPFSDSSFSKMIRDWGDENNDNDVEFITMTQKQMEMLLNILVAEPTVAFPCIDPILNMSDSQHQAEITTPMVCRSM